MFFIEPLGEGHGVCRVSPLGCSSNKGRGGRAESLGKEHRSYLSVCCVHRTDLPHSGITGASSLYP